MSLQPIIQVRNLNVTYFKGKPNEVRALKNISLEIYPGEFVIFFGPSGCGKSTLLYAIAALEREIEGEVIIDNRSLFKMSRDELEKYHQSKIGMVFQAYYLLPSLTVLDNVILPQMAIGGDPVKREKLAISLLRRFGVNEQRLKLPQELSGGQQQRVAICRSLINDPKVILADEPMGNLDSKSAAEVMSLLQQLQRQEKKTVILVTHDPTHLHAADRIFYLKDGELVSTKQNSSAAKHLVTTPKAAIKDQKLLQKEFAGLRHIYNTNQLESYQSEQVALELMAGLSWQELERTKDLVNSLFVSDGQYEALVDYFDRASREGGLDLDRRTADKLATEMKHFMTTVRAVRGEQQLANQIEAISTYVQTVFNLKIKGDVALKRWQEIVAARLKNSIDMKKVRGLLDASVASGGIGLESRLAYRIAKRLELIMLSRYHLDR